MNIVEDLGMDEIIQGEIVYFEERIVFRIVVFNIQVEEDDLVKVIENELWDDWRNFRSGVLWKLRWDYFNREVLVNSVICLFLRDKKKRNF